MTNVEDEASSQAEERRSTRRLARVKRENFEDLNADRTAQGWGVGGKVEVFARLLLPNGKIVRKRSKAPEPPEEHEHEQAGRVGKGNARPFTAPAKTQRKKVPGINLRELNGV